MTRPFVRTLVGAGALTIGLALGAMAQTSPVKPQPRDPNMPGPQNTVPEKVEGGAGATTSSTGTLSDKLEKSDGVITPPVTGGGKTIVPRDTGTMPVIPPAGTPGSTAPNADPK